MYHSVELELRNQRKQQDYLLYVYLYLKPGPDLFFFPVSVLKRWSYKLWFQSFFDKERKSSSLIQGCRGISGSGKFSASALDIRISLHAFSWSFWLINILGRKYLQKISEDYWHIKNVNFRALICFGRTLEIWFYIYFYITCFVAFCHFKWMHIFDRYRYLKWLTCEKNFAI